MCNGKSEGDMKDNDKERKIIWLMKEMTREEFVELFPSKEMAEQTETNNDK